MSVVTGPQRPRSVTAAREAAGGRAWVRPGLAVLAVAVVVGLLLRHGIPSGGIALSQLSWGWALLAALLTAVSFLGAGWNLSGFVPTPIPLRRVVAAQVVASGARVVTPAGLGAHRAPAIVMWEGITCDEGNSRACSQAQCSAHGLI